MREFRALVILASVLAVVVLCMTATQAESSKENRVHVTILESECSADTLKKYVRYLEKEIAKSWNPVENKSNFAKVGITFNVSSAGELYNLRLNDSSKAPMTDQAALKAVERMSFSKAPPSCGKILKLKVILG